MFSSLGGSILPKKESKSGGLKYCVIIIFCRFGPRREHKEHDQKKKKKIDQIKEEEAGKKRKRTRTRSFSDVIIVVSPIKKNPW